MILKIGTVRLSSRWILAPMAGISDLPFRMLNRSFGCECAFVEMINARCLGYKSVKTGQMLASGPEDRPLGVQLLGCEPDFIRRGMDILSAHVFDILDFNAACPERKVTRRGEGASLLKDPVKLQKLVALVVKLSKVPVTVKIRTGWDSQSINASEVAQRIQDAGACAVFVHGRTKQQGYGGAVDHCAIASVKKSVSIPVIASGDIFTPRRARAMIDDTGCDAVLVARGALGNPWIFREMEEYFEHGSLPPRPAVGDISDVMHEHLRLCVGFHGERTGVVSFRKFFIWYTWGHHSVRHLRQHATSARTVEQMQKVIEEFRSTARPDSKSKDGQQIGMRLADALARDAA
ncbi:MAG TPA: tRNA dihydrouridine synthase DusB [Candidatus Omnitrophota bacterium]|nr:tRNA dihydrouridine synthase DusB [Candidatus Omnitrophota bacterium]